MEVHGEKPLVEGMAESNADRADNKEKAEVEVDVKAVYTELINLDATHSYSEVEDAKGKEKECIAANMAALLTVLRPWTLPTGYDKVIMEEYG